MEQNSDCLPFFTSPLLSFDQMKNHLIVFEPNSAHTQSPSGAKESERDKAIKKVHFYFNWFIVFIFIFAEFFFIRESNEQIGLWLFRIPQWKSKTKRHTIGIANKALSTRLVDAVAVAAIATIRQDDNHGDCAACTMEIEIYVQHEIEVLHENFQQ